MVIDQQPPFEQRYELLKQLWLDGPHSGWLALDRLLNREVVVHRPYRENDVEQFLRHVKIRARLRHANLIPLYDLGTTSDDKPYFTEPYLHCMDMRRLLQSAEDKTHDVTLPRLMNYLLDAGKALAYLHANDFVHLAMCPNCIWIALQSHEVFLIREHHALPPVTVVNETVDEWHSEPPIFGVPLFMAPEQMNPKTLGLPDVLTDVYALGGVLFNILYDESPNGTQRDSLAELFIQVTNRKGPPRPGAFSKRAGRYPKLAKKLQPICLRALDSNRHSRQPSVAAFIKEVEECLWVAG